MAPTTPTAVIADDEMHMRIMVQCLLTSLSVNVVGEAANGEEALRLYREKKPDLLFLDVNMPLMTGDKALRILMRESPEAAVIMMTSVVDADSVETCLELGAAGYIRKDCPLDEMRRLIREVLEREPPPA